MFNANTNPTPTPDQAVEAAQPQASQPQKKQPQRINPSRLAKLRAKMEATRAQASVAESEYLAALEAISQQSPCDECQKKWKESNCSCVAWRYWFPMQWDATTAQLAAKIASR